MLGTDGAASNNSLSILSEMKFCALLQKFSYGAESFRAIDAFKMATENAEKAFRINAGKIEEGRVADIVLVDLRQVHFSPCHDLIANLVYSNAKVDTVIVDGRIVVENGHFDGEEKILEEFSKEVERFLT